MTHPKPSGLRWANAPWNNPRLCPSCGRTATVIVGGRRYSEDCARAMRLFLSSLQTREVEPGVVISVQP